MKKVLCVLCLLLVFSLAFSTLCFAEESNTDTIANWRVRIVVPEGTTAVLKGSSYYIYAKQAGAIPYVMLNTYRYDSEESFIADFTDYMAKHYSDLKVSSEAERKTVGDKDCYEIDYSYTVSGYDVRDRRIVMNVNGITYMFASKEIESRGDTVGSMLEEVVANCVFLDENGDPISGQEETLRAPAYLYREVEGRPKYWLDFTSAQVGDLDLHCYFCSEGETYYEVVYRLGMDTAETDGDTLRFHEVHDVFGNDYSPCFKELTVSIDNGAARMTVVRDDSTVSGSALDELLTGEYEMSPMRVGKVYEYRQDDGMLKYWLENYEQDLLLHAMFRSGDPEYYEEVFRLDLASAEVEGDSVKKIKEIYSAKANDVSAWFKSLTLSEVQGAIVMRVERDESTLAGGADDNILSGEYLFEPRSFLLPAHPGPYSSEELCDWAQIYYFTHTGYYPLEADAVANPDGSVTIHLYETVTVDGESYTATMAWYTVDDYGYGFDVTTEEGIDLLR